jgi:Secretion system C-terminal sorting domain
VDCDEGHPRLDWSAAEEAPGVRYTVEHSPSGERWEGIAELAGRGAGASYTYTPTHPRAGWLYRLRMRGQDGREEVSAVQSLDGCGREAPALQVWPQPSEGELTVAFESAQAQNGVLRLYNTAGQLVLRHEVAVQSGGNVLRLDLGHLPAGLYALHMVGGDGRVIGRVQGVALR